MPSEESPAPGGGGPANSNVSPLAVPTGGSVHSAFLYMNPPTAVPPALPMSDVPDAAQQLSGGGGIGTQSPPHSRRLSLLHSRLKGLPTCLSVPRARAPTRTRGSLKKRAAQLHAYMVANSLKTS